MNPEKFTLDLLDLLRRHGIVGEDGGKRIFIELNAPFDVDVIVEHY